MICTRMQVRRAIRSCAKLIVKTDGVGTRWDSVFCHDCDHIASRGTSCSVLDSMILDGVLEHLASFSGYVSSTTHVVRFTVHEVIEIERRYSRERITAERLGMADMCSGSKPGVPSIAIIKNTPSPLCKSPLGISMFFCLSTGHQGSTSSCPLSCQPPQPSSCARLASQEPSRLHPFAVPEPGPP